MAGGFPGGGTPEDTGNQEPRSGRYEDRKGSFQIKEKRHQIIEEDECIRQEENEVSRSTSGPRTREVQIRINPRWKERQTSREKGGVTKWQQSTSQSAKVPERREVRRAKFRFLTMEAGFYRVKL